MKKSITLIAALLVTIIAQAQSEPVADKPAGSSAEPKQAEVKVNKTLAGELPEAVLRLHDLEKREFKGEIIYAHKPLELAKIKNPIKFV